MTAFNVDEAEAQFSELIDRALAGEKIVVTGDCGTVQLVPVAKVAAKLVR